VFINIDENLLKRVAGVYFLCPASIKYPSKQCK
jgi:hypothetical protein